MAMESEKELSAESKLLRVKLQEGKVIIGQESVLKYLKSGRLSNVFVARNCPTKVQEDVAYYAKLARVSFGVLSYTNEDLGVFCKKNFFVSVLGIVQ
jgi:large subunit ribosomal protein L30e